MAKGSFSVITDPAPAPAVEPAPAPAVDPAPAGNVPPPADPVGSPAPAPEAAVAPAVAPEAEGEVDPDHVRPEAPMAIGPDGEPKPIREISPAFDAGPAEIPPADVPRPKKDAGPTVRVLATQLGQHAQGDEVPESEFKDADHLEWLIDNGFVEKPARGEAAETSVQP